MRYKPSSINLSDSSWSLKCQLDAEQHFVYKHSSSCAHLKLNREKLTGLALPYLAYLCGRQAISSKHKTGVWILSQWGAGMGSITLAAIPECSRGEDEGQPLWFQARVVNFYRLSFRARPTTKPLPFTLTSYLSAFIGFFMKVQGYVPTGIFMLCYHHSVHSSMRCTGLSPRRSSVRIQVPANFLLGSGWLTIND